MKTLAYLLVIMIQCFFICGCKKDKDIEQKKCLGKNGGAGNTKQ